MAALRVSSCLTCCLFLLAACKSTSLGTRPDASASSAGGGESGDASVAPDGGETDAGPARCEDAISVWLVAETGGAADESVADCRARLGVRRDARLPMNQVHVARAHGDGDAPLTGSCASDVLDGDGYYATGAHRWRCGQRLRVTAGDRCVFVTAVDEGTDVCEEASVGAPVLGLSGDALDALFDERDTALVDLREVSVAPVTGGNAEGPCTVGAAPLEGFIGGACESAAACSFDDALCETTPAGGLCTSACTGSCPDRTGDQAFTGCAVFDGEARCYARCDHTLFPAAGCRDGFACQRLPSPSDGSLRDVCVPTGCAP